MIRTEMIGQTFGRITVLKELPKAGREWRVLCKCVCGKEFQCDPYRINSGNTRSCGCLRKEVTGSKRTHGMSRTPEYDAWCRMKARCYKKSSKDYKWYGAKGVKVCDRWLESFENFLSDMGLKPSPDHTLERKNGKKDYSPENCVWELQKEQVRNQERTIKVFYNGEQRRLIEVCEELKVNPVLVRERINKKWDLHNALTAPKGTRLKQLAKSKTNTQ